MVALAALAILIAGAVRESRRGDADRLEIKHVNQRLEHAADLLNAELLNNPEYKRYEKQRKAEEKARQKPRAEPGARLFVLDFDGDIEASSVESLREEISALLQVVRPGDEVLLRLESAGGVVHGYGLAASQLRRLRDRSLRLTIAIDKVAASGGYLMASVADHIVAAPFAIIGSIGVVGQLPNFSRLLRDNKIDYELHTAGEYKRTLTMFGENTDAARAKFREELEQVHTLFKRFVAENRPKLVLEPVTTGEYWYGTQALSLGLVDELKTSDDLLLESAAKMDVYELRHRPKRDLRKWLLGGLANLGVGGAGLRQKLMQLP
ncbi:MAG: sohB [Nevskia sp.]|nr:sohB [Nevskia sp.]